MGGHLPTRLASLLHARAYRDADQAGGREWHPHQPDRVDDFLFLREPQIRACASAAGRDHPAQASRAAASRLSARKCLQVCATAIARDALDLRSGPDVFLEARTTTAQDRKRPGLEELYRSGADAG